MMTKLLQQPISIIIIVEILLFPLFVVIFLHIKKVILKKNEEERSDREIFINNEDELAQELILLKKEMAKLQEQIRETKSTPIIIQGDEHHPPIISQDNIAAMNENISKFVAICKEKDQALEEKNNKIISLHQQYLELEMKFKKLAIAYKQREENHSIEEEFASELKHIKKKISIEHLQNRVIIIGIICFLTLLLIQK